MPMLLRRPIPLPNATRTLALLALLVLLPSGLGAQAAPLAGLDEYISRAMPDWEVPGLAIAVIR
ncbi:MAG TPA: hypothetical protein VHG09_00805, partial [Longimicrobiales bacterium]|nr:hypothetical protein [Longimicrobiales bacterium]